ncbi:MAG: YjfB family protein [Gammaproteobacteria bacterium]|nr:YjfB family protein [Gammaproteobacteria bacterium]
MDIAGAQLSSVASMTTQSDASVAVLKKTMDIQKQTAMQLIEAIPQPPSATVGQNINIKV